ncbi:hypothetical protein V8F20_001370 [Naviculisporaceae sp. PSN 640]
MSGYNDSEDGSLWRWCRENAIYINHARPGSNDTIIKFDARDFSIHDIHAVFHRSARWRNRVIIAYTADFTQIVVHIPGLNVSYI